MDHAQQRDRAVEACQTLFDRSYSPAVVVDAVYPLNGHSICFYVLGDLGDSLPAITQELESQLQLSVAFESIIEPPAEGCGSGCCSTASSTGGGCSSGGCASCPAVAACKHGGSKTAG